MIDFGRKIKKMQGKGTEADLNRLRKGRAPWGSIILIYGVAALIGAGAFFGYRCYYESQNDGFLAGTAVDGCDVSGKTIGEAVKLIEDKYADSEIVVTENGEVDLKGDLAFYGYTMDGKALEERLQQDFAASKNDMQSVFLSLLGYYDHQIDVELSFDETTFKKNVNSASLKVTRFPSEDAYLYCDEKTRTIEVRPEVQGNEIDDKILQEYIS
ncbi:MAG: hypothetical protein Q4F25_02850, partial [Eubacteriales bacterium]|nr:hypothetical protein [Eubacteriales bacterium]